MNVKKVSVILCIVLILLCSGCNQGKQGKETGQCVYYINTDGTGLVKADYKRNTESTEKDVEQMLKNLQKPPKTIDYQAAIPKETEVEKYELGKNKLDLYFNSAYYDLNTVEELLCRSAVVQTLTQNSAIQFVEFYVDGAPLKDRDGKTVGPMRNDDFIQNTGSQINAYQATTLELYFSNKSGDELVKETVNVRYNSNLSIEKLIVERLMKGPSGDGAIQTISQDAKLLGVSVKDGICYVNFDEGFLNNTLDLEPKITIYAIVNSITKNGTASKVQISISGETDVTFKGSVKLDEPFSSDMKLVENKK